MGNRRHKYRFPLLEELEKIFFFYWIRKVSTCCLWNHEVTFAKSYPRILSYLFLSLSS